MLCRAAAAALQAVIAVAAATHMPRATLVRREKAVPTFLCPLYRYYHSFTHTLARMIDNPVGCKQPSQMTIERAEHTHMKPTHDPV